MQATEPAVLFLLQTGIAVTRTRSDQLGHAALHQSFGQFGVFQLVTYSHTQTRTHQLG